METKPRPRKRAKHSRSKMGCRVCRIRRVRCDMTRPACLKCTSTGRTCEGYPAVASPTSTNAIFPRALVISVSDDPLEERSWSFFQNKTAQEFATPFGSEFWSRLVLQVGAREPCVRHAVIALGFLHKSFAEGASQKLPSPYNETPHNPFSISDATQYAREHYGKALNVLNGHIRTQSWKGLDVSLLCCILCVGFDWLCGSYEAANVHMRSGLLVLRQWYESRESNGATGSRISYTSPSGHLIRGQIAPMLMRLAIQTRTLVDDMPSIPWTSVACLQSGPKRSSLQTAREDLDVMLSEIYLNPSNFSPAYPTSTLSASTQEKFCLQLAKWYSEYQMHLLPPDVHQRDDTDNITPDKISLTLWYTILTIMLATSRTLDQGPYDAYIPQFQHILSLADILLTTPPPHIATGPTSSDLTWTLTTRSHFRVDMETVPTLYYVASRCRHPALRRRAIWLLRTGAYREGLWDSYAQARLAEEIVRIEEEGIVTVIDEKSVPAPARIFRIEEETNLDERKIKVRFWQQGDEDFGEWKVLHW